MAHKLLGRVGVLFTPFAEHQQRTITARFEPLEQRVLLSGTPFIVDSLLDIVESDGVVTFREAIEAANTNTAVTADVMAGVAFDVDSITFDKAALSAEAGVEIGEPLTITLGGTQLEISDDLNIQGLGVDLLAVDADGLSRVFSIPSEEIEVGFSNLTITGGHTAKDGGGIANAGVVTLTNTTLSGNSTDRYGGGIASMGTVTLTDSTLSGNTSTLGGGGISNVIGTVVLTNSTVSGNSSIGGGGISNSGMVTLTNSTLSGNTAEEYGGGITNSGTVTLTNSTVSGNSAGIEGGGIVNIGEVTLTDSTLSDNSAGEKGGGISLFNVDSIATLINSTLSNNTAVISGGGISNSGTVTLTDMTLSNNSANVGGGISNAGNVSLTNSTLAENSAAIAGGGLANAGTAMLMDSTLSENSTSMDGGGLANYGTLMLADSEVSGNTAVNSGGGIFNMVGTVTLTNSTVSGNSTSEGESENIGGGGIFNAATMTLVKSTVFDNSAYAGGGIANVGSLTTTNSEISGNSAFLGGGVANAGAATLVNSVLSGNSVVGDFSGGGGIYVDIGKVDLINSTVSGNWARGDSAGGGGIYINEGKLTLGNSIVALNGALVNADIDGNGSSENFKSKNSLVGVDPRFATNPSAGEDGIWGTPDDVDGDFRLVSPSPAISGGNNSLLPADKFDLDDDGNTTERLPIDLEGEDRITDLTVDIGAYEAGPFYELTAQIVNPKLPSSVMSGDGTRITLPVRVINEGSSSIERKQRIDLAVYARPSDAVDDSQDELVAMLLNKSISKLKPGNSKKINVPVYLPAGLVADDYFLVAEVDASNNVEELDEDNNTAVTSTPIDVELGEIDLVGVFGKVTLPPAIVLGQGANGKAPVTVTNEGSVALVKGQKIDVQVLFRPLAGGDDILLATATSQSLSGLKPGKSKTINVNVEIPADLVAGDYALVAVVDLGDDVPDERHEDNNEAVHANTYTLDVPFFDLMAQIVNPKLPATTVSGDGTRITLPVQVTNEGNVPIERNQRIDLAVYARPSDAADDSQDVLVATLANQSVSKLKPGSVKKINVSVYLPAGLVTDAYVLVAEVDAADAVAESNEDNNTAVTSTPIDVELGEIDLVGVFGKVTLPPAIVLGQGAKGKAPVTVTNEGNVALAKGQKIDVQVLFRPLSGGDDILLATAESQSLSGLKPDKSKTINVNVEIPGDLDAGDYALVAVVDSGDDVPDERHEDNNEALHANTYALADPFFDLTAQIVNPKLPATTVSGDGTRITLPVHVTNQGNVPIERNQRIDLAVYARPSDAADDSQDVLVSTLTNQSVSNLKPGAVKKINVSVYLPAGLVTDAYVLVAEVDAADAVVESDEDNNTAVTETPIDVELGEIDLVGVFGKVTLPPAIVLGQGAKGKAPVTVTNEGNVALAKGQKIDVQVLFRPLAGGDDILLATAESQSVSGLKPDKSKTIKVNVEIPGDLDAGDYALVAVVDSGDDVPDERHEDNNEAVHANTYTLADPFFDLTAQIVNPKLPLSVVSGDGTRITLPVQVSNQGNVPIERNQRIDLAVYARPADAADDSQDVLVSTLTNQSISNLKPGAVKKINVSVYLPAGLVTDAYVLVAEVDAANAVVESDEDNNTAVTSTSIDVELGFIEFVAELDDKAQLPDLLLAADGSKMSMPVKVTNNGNVPTPSDTLVDVVVVVRQPGGDPADDIEVKSYGEIKIGTLKPGQTKELNLSNIINNVPELNDSYQLIARLTPNIASDTSIVEVESHAIRFVESFMELTMFDVAGVTRRYDAILSASAEGILVGSDGTYETYVSSLGDDDYLLTITSDTPGEEEVFQWSDKPSGLVLTQMDYEIDDDELDAEVTMAFSDLLVGPVGLKVNQTHTDTAHGSVNIKSQGYGINVNFDLDVTATSKLIGYETVTVPYGTLDVAKANVVFTFNAKGSIQGQPANFTIKETMDIYATPELGIVQLDEKLSFRLSVKNWGSVSGSGTGTFKLLEISGLPV